MQTGWTLIRVLLSENSTYKLAKFRAQRISYQKDYFDMKLKKERKYDCTPWKNEVQIGNPNSAVQLTIYSNPYCVPCAKAHAVIHKLLKNNDLGVSIRFAVHTMNEDDPRTKAVSFILQRIEDTVDFSTIDKQTLISDWFDLMNLDLFRKKYPHVRTSDVSEQLESHFKWSEESDIRFTPTVIYNGFELPKEYDIEDLSSLIR